MGTCLRDEGGATVSALRGGCLSGGAIGIGVGVETGYLVVGSNWASWRGFDSGEREADVVVVVVVDDGATAVSR